MRGLFVTATDTGVGKTVLSCSLIAAMRAAGVHARAHKPAVTGLDDPPFTDAAGTVWPPDHELLAAAAEMAPEDVAPHRFGPAVSPHLAAELAGTELRGEELIASALAAADAAAGPLVVEGIGGVLVPLTGRFTVLDLAVALGLPLVVAARPGLGTINHTLLTLRAAREAGLAVAAVVLTPWPERPDAMELSNRRTIETLGDVPVAGLAKVPRPVPAELAHAGSELPWRQWLGGEQRGG